MGTGTSMISNFGLSTLVSNIQDSIDKLKKYPSDSESSALVERYLTLQTSVNSDMLKSTTMNPDILASKQASYNANRDQLDRERDIILLRLNPSSDAIYWYKQITYGVGMLFAIIIMTNKMVATEPYYKLLFYVPWALIFYPLVLAYGAFYTPDWHAPFIPIFQKPVTNPIIAFLFFTCLYEPPTRIPITTEKKSTFTPLKIFTFIVLIAFIIALFTPTNV